MFSSIYVPHDSLGGTFPLSFWGFWWAWAYTGLVYGSWRLWVHISISSVVSKDITSPQSHPPPPQAPTGFLPPLLHPPLSCEGRDHPTSSWVPQSPLFSIVQFMGFYANHHLLKKKTSLMRVEPYANLQIAHFSFAFIVQWKSGSIPFPSYCEQSGQKHGCKRPSAARWHPLGTCPGVVEMVHVAGPFSASWETSRLSSKVATLYHRPMSSIEGFLFHTTVSAFVDICIPEDGHSDGVRWILKQF